MTIIIVDHFAKTVYTDLRGKKLAHEINMRNNMAINYLRMPLKSSFAYQIPATTGIIMREHGIFWIETVGDLEGLVGVIQ